MNVLYLIGNGFDRNLGLDTSYTQFYQSYLSEKSTNKNVSKFKDFLFDCQSANKYELWSDLELLIGESSAIYDNAKDFREVYLDVNNSLRRYILLQNARFASKKQLQDAFLNHIKNPVVDLTSLDKSNMLQYVSQIGKNWDVSIVSFNYTYCVDDLAGSFWGEDIGKNCFDGTTKLSKVCHIHGYCDNTILVGLNDPSQIKNLKFRSDQSLLRCIVKPISNTTIGLLNDEKCRSLVASADLIIGYGLSYGATDKYWWDMISGNLNQLSKRMIVFDYTNDNNIDLTHNAFLIGDLKDINGKRILGSLFEPRRLSHIYYAMNSKMFSDIRSCV